ncbi:TRAP transporter large permease [Pseudooceanicola sp.]|uniref:TRAP transporter large permease n=1 Tax=Pseudooceanicola sp. TaxID=1914328 RepID=UPI000C0BA2AD|nr:C4-dicarboxylate ABC transporter permease [Pseudooceanicola sp.]
MEFLAPVSLLLGALLVFGMPIGFAMGIAGTVGLYLIGGFNLALGILSVAPYRNTASWLLTAIPLFILMAEILSASRISSDMFRAANRWVGHLPGGLAVATVFTSAGFGAVSGSSTAATATMARTVAPEAEKYGYDRGMIVGTVAAAGTLSIMIPPSVVLMVYGIITETSIGGLFIAGIVPGLITALSFAGITMIWATMNRDLAPPAQSHGWRERFLSLRELWPVVLLFVFVVAGIYSGAVTVTEAAAVGCFGAILIASVMLRRMGWRDFVGALERTTRPTAMIFTIIIGAHIFGYFVTLTMAPQALVSYVEGLDISPGVVILILIVIYVLLGCVMDQLAILILTMPIVFPMVMELGYSPIWFGILVTKTVEIGLITPPIGMNVFVASSITGVPLKRVFVGVLPFVLAEFAILALIAFFPEIVTMFSGEY